MKKLSRYSRPNLHGHKTLYKGKRYWVFEVSSEYPFEGYEEEFSLVLYDCLYGGVITGGKMEEGKAANEWIYGEYQKYAVNECIHASLFFFYFDIKCNDAIKLG